MRHSARRASGAAAGKKGVRHREGGRPGGPGTTGAAPDAREGLSGPVRQTGARAGRSGRVERRGQLVDQLLLGTPRLLGGRVVRPPGVLLESAHDGPRPLELVLRQPGEPLRETRVPSSASRVCGGAIRARDACSVSARLTPSSTSTFAATPSVSAIRPSSRCSGSIA